MIAATAAGKVSHHVLIRNMCTRMKQERTIGGGQEEDIGTEGGRDGETGGSLHTNYIIN